MEFMRTIEEINSYILDIRADINTRNEFKRGEEKMLREKIQTLMSLILYLERNPNINTVRTQLERVNSTIKIIENQETYNDWIRTNSTDINACKNLNEMRAKYETCCRLEQYQKQQKNLEYLLLLKNEI